MSTQFYSSKNYANRIMAGEGTDSNYSSVSLLLHFNGTNGSTTFTDNSPSPKTVTVHGNAQISTAQRKFNGASGLFDGTGDYLTIADNADFGFGTGDFTCECFIRLGGTPSGAWNILDFRTANDAQTWVWNINSSRYLGGYSSAGSIPSGSTTAITVDTWQHIAITRESGTIRQFLDGNIVGSGTNSNSFQTSRPLYIGANPGGTDTINAYIDDLRITKGVARYTANFIPPTQEFPNR